MTDRRYRLFPLAGMLATLLLLLSVTAYGLYRTGTDNSKSDLVTLLQSNSAAFVRSVESDATYHAWIVHSAMLILLLKNQLSKQNTTFVQNHLPVNQLGIIGITKPDWSLTLQHSPSGWITHYNTSVNVAPTMATSANFNNPYFNYFIPITLQNKVVGDFYIEVTTPPGHSDTLPFYPTLFIDLVLGLLLTYFSYLVLSNSEFSANSFALSVLAYAFPWMYRRKNAVLETIHDERWINTPLDKLVNDIIHKSEAAVIRFNLSGLINLFDQAAIELTGLDIDDGSYCSLADLVNALDISHPQIKFLINELNNKGYLYNAAVDFFRYDTKEPRVALITVIEFPEKSHFAGYLVFLNDITEVGLKSKTVSYTDRLNLVAEFAASTAHEIRNPLTTVRGFLQLQKKRETNDRTRSYYRVMIDEIDRVDQLISEYLLLARNSTLHVKEQLSISTLITHLLPLITAEANMRNVEVMVNHVPGVFCMGNSNELKQVFLNLCKNAMDAMKDGGRLTIDGYEDKGQCTIVVKDTGIGMTNEVMRHIFEPFYTTKQTGSGLGLPVSKKIVESHQGSISVQSEPEEGTTFFITIPLLDKKHMLPS